MAPGRPMHDVELVEDDGPVHGRPGAPVDVSPAPPGRRPRRTLIVLGAALLTVVLVAAGVGQVVQDRRERTRLATLAAHPAVVDVLAGAPEVLWERVAPDTLPTADVRTADGLLVGVEATPRGPVRVVATDAATGEEAWATELLDGEGRPAPEPGVRVFGRAPACATLAGEPHLVVCLAHDGVETVRGREYTALPPTVSRVVVLDTRDGSVVTELTDAVTTRTLPTSLATVSDQVVLLAEDGPQGELQALTAQGAPVWRLDFEVTLPDDDGPTGTRLVGVGDALALVTVDEARVLDATGGTVRTVPRLERYSAASDGVLTLEPGSPLYPALTDVASLPDAERTTVVRAEGVVDVVGAVVPTVLDDGSVPGFVMTRVQDRLTVWDGDGDQRWDAPASNVDEVMVLDGRVHLVRDAELVTLDARTGAELWRSKATTRMPVTDGEHLLAPARAAPWEPLTEMVALDPADGTEVWRAPLPEGTNQLEVHLRLLVAVHRSPDGHDQQMVVLG